MTESNNHEVDHANNKQQPVVVADKGSKNLKASSVILILLVAFFAFYYFMNYKSLGVVTAPLSVVPTPQIIKPEPSAVGSAIQVGGDDGVSVKLVSISDPATSVSEYSQLESGMKFVSLKLEITNNGTKTYKGNANYSTTILASNRQNYTVSFLGSVDGCTNFTSGEYTLAAGEIAVGCVMFELPVDVSASMVRFKTTEVLDTSAEWKI